MLMRVFLRDKTLNPKQVIRAGMLSLAISIVWPRLLAGRSGLSGDAADLVQGLFLGVALALFFWGGRLGGFRRPSK
jgi:hypothetical protein